jgi:hypothetical protein
VAGAVYQGLLTGRSRHGQYETDFEPASVIVTTRHPSECSVETEFDVNGAVGDGRSARDLPSVVTPRCFATTAQRYPEWYRASAPPTALLSPSSPPVLYDGATTAL